MSHPMDDPMSVPQDFSSLEVVLRRTDEGFKEVQETPEKLTVPFDESKEVHNAGRSALSQLWGSSFNGSHLSVASPSSALSAASSFTNLLPDKEAAVEYNQRTKKICGLPAKAFWPLVAVTFIVVALVVGVPVGVYVRKSKSTASPTAGSSLAALPTPTPASAAPSSPAPLSLTNNSSGLASVAWNDTKGTMQYRLYFQDDQHSIKESAWNASSNKWQEIQTIGQARAKTPITATVTGPQNFSFELSVYALSDSGSIIEWTTKDANTFGSGNMTSQNIKPANESSLTALWDRHPGCPECANTLLFAYQRSDGQLEVGNYTQSAWVWTTLQSNPAQGTDLALALRWQSAASGDIRLFYQIKDGHLVSQDYNGPRTPPSFTWISRESGPITQLTSISPLASFTYGDTSRGDALYNDVISANSSGLTANWWSGVYDLNGDAQSSGALASVHATTALAANEDKHFYALQQNGTISEFQMLNDDYHWAYVGDVRTG